MDRLEAMAVFIAVVETGGFSSEAWRLDSPLATVSEKVAELDDHRFARRLTCMTRKTP
jgi:DNA-binding transcriptional LysR family regulator